MNKCILTCRNKLLKLCPYLCGILYALFLSLAVYYYVDFSIQCYYEELSHSEFNRDILKNLYKAFFCIVCFLLTLCGNVIVFNKVKKTVCNILFEVLFPVLSVVPLAFVWDIL